MSCVIGIDVSSHAIDLVRLDETTNDAEWVRVTLEGTTAWDRARKVRLGMPGRSFWDDCYLAAIEKPQCRGFNAAAALMRVQGAVLCCIPGYVHLWEVTPQEWKRELGIKLNVKPTFADLASTMDGLLVTSQAGAQPDLYPLPPSSTVLPQDALDALGVAYYARETNARGIAA